MYGTGYYSLTMPRDYTMVCSHCILLFSVFLAVVDTTPMAITSCPRETYAILNANGDGIAACRPCSRCPPGYGVQQQCTATQNTVCALCDIGSFSFSISMVDACRPCRSCAENGELEECSPISDTVCKKACQWGFYYDPSTDECTRCSYCFPDRPNARTVRVEDCRLQNRHTDYQCSPLPSPDAGDSWSPPVMLAVRDRGINGAGIGHSGTDRFSAETAIRFPNGSGRDILRSIMGDVGATDRTSNRHIVSAEPTTSNIAINLMGGGDVRQFDSLLVSTREPIISDTLPTLNKDGESENSEGASSDEQQSQPRYRSLTSSDIWLVVVIALSCGLISCATTAITCHCLTKRGKNVGPKVNSVGGKAPALAWTYQDALPSAIEMRNLIDTPPQTRKITCV